MGGMAPRILFLPDAGRTVGGGHVMRSLTLAKALEARGAECVFVASPPAQRLLNSFGEPRGGTISAPDAEDLDGLVGATSKAVEERQASVVVVDHYRLGRDAEARLRPARVAVIDDLADRSHDCDLLVDPSLGHAPETYDGLVPDGTKRLVGVAYALVRPEFAALREQAMARRERRDPVRRALVSLGLTDPDGMTRKVVSGLLDDFGRMEVDVAVGREAESLPFLEGLAAADFRIRLHVETPDMARLMAEADIGVGAGGSTVWERACLGLPSLTVVVAQNQRAVALELQSRGATLALDAHALAFEAMLSAEWYGLAANAAARRSMSQKSAALCDGKGAERVADAVMELAGQGVALGGQP
jgi:UDP-2,4-diacetamido-2,4,6-trideoxy-beta-L-altropyranose hydrolase